MGSNTHSRTAELISDERNAPGQGGSAAFVLERARYAEDKIEEAVRSGTTAPLVRSYKAP